MKPCPVCETPNTSDARFCRQCGRSLEAVAAIDATVLWKGQHLSAVGALRQSLALSPLFAAKTRLIVGRAPDCDIFLSHPSVSRYHALIQKRSDGLQIRDLGSVNGVSVDGQRITDPHTLREGSRIGIGPFLLTLTGNVLQSLDSSRSLRLEARGLEKVIRQSDGTPRKLLDDINLCVNPGEFVSLLGPSGSGKSTLMDALNGRRRATGGSVIANGEDFYRHFDNFRQSLGYVPQKDIVHSQLTVYNALYYTAQLRLPTDTEPDEMKARVEQVVAEMELEPHRATLIGNLSGGQIKRVSLGAELLAQPCMLYIDEATSGLDAGTEARMMRLFRRLADEGRSLLCITHNVDNVERCHLITVLARGRLVYYGPPAEATVYFKVKKISEIYDRLAERPTEEWVEQFKASALHNEFIVSRLTKPPTAILHDPTKADVARPELPKAEEASAAEPHAESSRLSARFSQLLVESGKLLSPLRWVPQADQIREFTARHLRWREVVTPIREGWHQFFILTTRYVDLIFSDRRSLRLLLLQAPLVALFLLLGFWDKPYQERLELRKPTQEEKAALRGMIAARRMALSSDDLNDEQRARLEEYVLKLPGDIELSGPMILAALRLIGARGDLAQARQHFEAIRFRFPSQGGSKQITGADVLQSLTPGDKNELSGSDVLKILAESDKGEILQQLLDADDPVLPAPNPYPGPDNDTRIINPRNVYTLQFIMVMIILWFGTNNAAKEIIKEEAIYSRERSVNLGILPYLASKFLVLSLLTTLHVILLMSIVYGSLHLLAWFAPGICSVPSGRHNLAYLPQFFVLSLVGMTGVALGLLLSACVSSEDRANALLPYVLIPQMILGGGFITVKDGLLLALAMPLSPVYWGYRAIHLGTSALPASFPGHTDVTDGIALPCLALLLQLAALLVSTALCLKFKEG